MTQQTLIAIGTLLNAFPASAGDVDVLVRSFEAATADVPPAAVCEAAKRYMEGRVDGQNTRFAPSVAEFAMEARRLAELRQAISRPRLPSSTYLRSGPAPFQVKAERLRTKYADWTVIRKGVSFDEWRTLCASKQIPAGAMWIAALDGSVMVPPNQQKAGA